MHRCIKGQFLRVNISKFTIFTSQVNIFISLCHISLQNPCTCYANILYCNVMKLNVARSSIFRLSSQTSTSSCLHVVILNVIVMFKSLTLQVTKQNVTYYASKGQHFLSLCLHIPTDPCLSIKSHYHHLTIPLYSYC